MSVRSSVRRSYTSDSAAVGVEIPLGIPVDTGVRWVQGIVTNPHGRVEILCGCHSISMWMDVRLKAETHQTCDVVVDVWSLPNRVEFVICFTGFFCIFPVLSLYWMHILTAFCVPYGYISTYHYVYYDTDTCMEYRGFRGSVCSRVRFPVSE